MTLTPDQIGGIVRALLAAASGYLIGKGWVDADTAATLGGAVVTLVVTGWSWWTNRPAKIA